MKAWRSLQNNQICLALSPFSLSCPSQDHYAPVGSPSVHTCTSQGPVTYRDTTVIQGPGHVSQTVMCTAWRCTIREFYCALFEQSNKCSSGLGVPVKTPFTKFTRAKGKDGILTNHATNLYHEEEASRQAQAFINTYTNPQTRIDSRVSLEAQRLSEVNQHILSEIVQTILLLGRQGLPLRGHRDEGTADSLVNRGNFLALLEHTASRDSVVNEHLQRGKRNQKYISKTIQNEIILTAAECLKEKILHSLQKISFYSIIADEVTDPHANQKVLAVCVRFLDLSKADCPQIREVFVDFMHLKRATGVKVGQAIMEME